MKLSGVALMFIWMIFISCSSEKKESIEGEIANFGDNWKLQGIAINEPGYDIWGSSPISDENGNVHLFCARWPSNKPFISSWRKYSEIAQYTADTPEGPFKFNKIIRTPQFDGKWNAEGFHNPNIRKIDDKYVLVFIANDGDPKHGPNQRIGMVISNSINGPWVDTPVDQPLLSPPLGKNEWCYDSGCGVNNPSLIKHPNGKYYLYFKAMSGPRPEGKVSMGVAVSDKLEGPYVIQPSPITANDKVIEDGYAFIWGDKICLLTTDNHGMLEEGGGLLWVSDDGLRFNDKPYLGFHHFGRHYLQGEIPENANARYTPNVKFERPQILMNSNNQPEYLYCPSGVAVDGSDGTNSYVLKYEQN